ncbi:ferric-chelate reductase 1 [Brachionus plicatilis]|uniref:Ferric-chelate reductase 1 n=1 Tax=Brachionus plicatilis TaxID=10195 RepID=A0A3M7R7T0_BRAPC|nr:ferric-chelate reductase 1 [Brachionus plicatilis]
MVTKIGKLKFMIKFFNSNKKKHQDKKIYQACRAETKKALILGSDEKLVTIQSKLVHIIDSKKSDQSQLKKRSKRDVFDFFQSATELCGSRKSCYVSLQTCDVDPKTCNFVLSWEYDGQLVNFELTALSKAWVAVVLSDDRYLGNDNIIVCSRYPETERLSIDHYYKKKDDSVLYKIEPEDYLKNKEISYNAKEAYITCRFSRPKTVDNEFVSDLSKPHFIYVERGAPGEMIVEKLNRLYQPSESQVEFASNIYVTTSPRSWLVKVHAILGIIAWVFLGSIGILLARYYKPLWPNQVLNSFRVWFSFHRSIMIFVTLLSLLSLLFALVELNWNWSSNGNDYLHSILGVIVIICSCINPILGFFRPSPTSYLRCLYFWCHWLVGVVAYCLAIPTIFIGMDLSKSDVPNWCSWLLFFWVIFHIIVEIVLEVHYCCTFSQLQGNYSEKNTDYDKINKIPIKKKNPPIKKKLKKHFLNPIIITYLEENFFQRFSMETKSVVCLFTSDNFEKFDIMEVFYQYSIHFNIFFVIELLFNAISSAYQNFFQHLMHGKDRHENISNSSASLYHSDHDDELIESHQSILNAIFAAFSTSCISVTIIICLIIRKIIMWRFRYHSRIKIQRYSKNNLKNINDVKENIPNEIENKPINENLNLIVKQNFDQTIPKKFCPKCSPNNFL